MDDRTRHDPEPPAPEEGTPAGCRPRVIESATLFAGRREVDIRHGGETYRLRVTRNGKLILNK